MNLSKQQWLILLVSAMTDFIINAGTALTAAMVVQGNAMLPTWPVLLLAGIGGLVSASRTVQQALKASEAATPTGVSPSNPVL